MYYYKRGSAGVYYHIYLSNNLTVVFASLQSNKAPSGRCYCSYHYCHWLGFGAGSEFINFLQSFEHLIHLNKLVFGADLFSLTGRVVCLNITFVYYFGSKLIPQEGNYQAQNSSTFGFSNSWMCKFKNLLSTINAI